MAQRSDAPLIKHLTQTYGPETARDWQRPPLVLLPDDGLVAHMWSRYDDLMATLDAYESPDTYVPFFPWDDALYDVRGGMSQFAVRDVPDLMGELAREYGSAPWSLAWLRVRQLGNWVRNDPASSPWLRDDERGNLADARWQDWPMGLLVERWLQNRAGMVSHPLVLLLDRDNLHRLAALPMAPEDRADPAGFEADARMTGRFVWMLMAYLAQCNEYLTEVTPTATKPLPPNRQKVHAAKPWLNEHLPHYILLDPTRAAEYGHPSAQRPPAGHHASPHPHTRRGHWAVLRHEKFARNEDGTLKRVWRKQAWVGATEWTDNLNQMYRVVLPTQEDS